MLSINPNTNFPIVRKLGDPSDLGTNYVRAVIRNSVSGVVLKTVDLTDDGGQRFNGSYLVGPAEDWFFDITTTVYTDSGYTTKSTTYSEENDTYKVQTSWGLQFAGMGAGSDINYKKIDSLIKDNLKVQNWLTVEDISKIVNIPISDIKALISPILPAIKGIIIPEVKIPEQKEVDLIPIIEKIDSLSQILTEISGKKIETSVIEDMIRQYMGVLNTNINEIENKISISSKGITDQINKNVSSDEKLQRIKGVLGEIIDSPKTEQDTKNISNRVKSLIK